MGTVATTDGGGVNAKPAEGLVLVPCTVCRADEARPAFVVDGYRIVRCASCNHLYVSPRPTMDAVQHIYGENYFENPAFVDTDSEGYYGYSDYVGDRPNIEARQRQILNRIERHCSPGRLLDIGCGPGFFVDLARRQGWDAAGVELNPFAVRWAGEHGIAQVTVGAVDDLDLPDASLDCVTIFDVIEHLADPRVEMEHVWRVLRPGGLLVLITPNAGSPVSRALGSRWLEMKRAPEHLHFFTVDGLASLLDSCGFSAFEWHSIGKITTLHNLLADLKFYGPGFFGAVDRGLERVGLGQRAFDIDPRTKMCVYARRTGQPAPLAPGRVTVAKPARLSRRALVGRAHQSWRPDRSSSRS